MRAPAQILMNTLSSGVNASVAAVGNMKHSMGKEDLGLTLSGMRRDGWLRGQLAPIELSLNFTGFSQVCGGLVLGGTMLLHSGYFHTAAASRRALAPCCRRGGGGRQCDARRVQPQPCRVACGQHAHAVWGVQCQRHDCRSGGVMHLLGRSQTSRTPPYRTCTGPERALMRSSPTSDCGGRECSSTESTLLRLL